VAGAEGRAAEAEAARQGAVGAATTLRAQLEEAKGAGVAQLQVA
jgi:hypothetical protein